MSQNDPPEVVWVLTDLAGGVIGIRDTEKQALAHLEHWRKTGWGGRCRVFTYGVLTELSVGEEGATDK